MYYNTAVAYILWALGGFGVLGLHRFYLRKIPTGILWVCTGGLFTLGAAYDFFTLPRQVREANNEASYRDAISNGRQTVIIRERYEEPSRRTESRVKDSIEKVALRVAKKNGGVVSPGEVALDSDYTSDQAREALEKLAGKGLCELRVRPSGVVVFRFPEFASDEQGFEI